MVVSKARRSSEKGVVDAVPRIVLELERRDLDQGRREVNWWMLRVVKCYCENFQKLKRAFALSFCGVKTGQLRNVVLQLCIAEDI